MKKYSSLVFLFSTLIIVLVGIFNFLIDPFLQYRKPILYKPYYKGDERYLNPGLAKNYEYDSVVVGSSMTENFLISDVQKIMPNPIKLTISGASAHEIYLTLNTVFEANPNTENVLIGLDMYSVSGEVRRLRHGEGSIPFYLYDRNYFNDYYYLLSFDTTIKSFKSLVRQHLKNSDVCFNYENMYQWQHLFENDFGRINVLKQACEQKSDFTFDDSYHFEKMKKSFDFNILSIIKNHPNTHFIIFYPPYSIIAYKNWENKQMLNDILKFKVYAFQELQKLQNAKVYDFQVASEITHNLDNYKDDSHYHQKINTWMIEKIAQNEFRVNENNIKKINEELLIQSKSWFLPCESSMKNIYYTP